MNTVANKAKQAIQDEFQSRIRAAVAKLDSLKAHAQTAKANVEIKAIAELLPKKAGIQQELQELKESASDRWEQGKADLESRIEDFEKSVKEIQSKAKAS